MPRTKLTTEILTAAITGYECERDRIEARIAEIKELLISRTKATASTTGRPHPKKRSAAVRKRMALAQRARYAKLKGNSELPQAEAANPKKRKLSAAGRRAIIAATERRWAAEKAAKNGL